MNSPNAVHQTLMDALRTVSSTEMAYIPFCMLKLKSSTPRNVSPPPQTSDRSLPRGFPFMSRKAAPMSARARMVSGRGKECSNAW